MGDESTVAGLRTPLYELHVEQGGKMVTFAGYDLPIQYRAGVMQEHLHTRQAAGLFDVSHMGQIEIRARSGAMADAAAALERLVPADVVGLAPGRQRYAVFTDEAGGVLDDLMIANLGNRFYLVVNAACKAADLAHLQRGLSSVCHVVEQPDRALLALQGPLAERILSPLAPDAAKMAFMDVREIAVAGVACTVSRSGYTGEDGYEIGMPAEDAMHVATVLLASPDVMLIGLGARDSLRLEAGLCLYGSDLTPTTTPVEAAIEWSIQKSRRPGGKRPGRYPGAGTIGLELERGASRRRVGLRPVGRAPIRAGTMLYAAPDDPSPVGFVTSGGFGPSVGAPIAMGYIEAAQAVVGTLIHADVRGSLVPVHVANMPFTTKTYKR